MIEGIKLIFFRSLYGIMVMIGIMPIWNKIFSYVQTQNITFCGESIPYIVLGVQQIPWLIMISIGLACIQTYYRGVSQRRYEGLYSQGEIISAYER